MKFLNNILARLRDAYAARYEPEGLRPLADTYWRSVLAIAFVVAVLAVLYGVWDLADVLNGLSASADAPVTPAPALDRSKLEATLNGFQARDTQFNSLETNPSQVISDPSK